MSNLQPDPEPAGRTSQLTRLAQTRMHDLTSALGVRSDSIEREYIFAGLDAEEDIENKKESIYSLGTLAIC